MANNALPLILAGAAAVFLLGGKKKKPSSKEESGAELKQFKFHKYEPDTEEESQFQSTMGIRG